MASKTERSSISLSDLNRFLVEALEQRGVRDAEHVARTVLKKVRARLEGGLERSAPNRSSRPLAPLASAEPSPATPAPLEHERRSLLNLHRESRSLTDPFGRAKGADPEELAILRRAVFELPPADRSLLLAYHSASGAQAIAVRRRLAEQLGTSVPDLRNRALAVHRRLLELLDAAEFTVGAAS